MPQGELKIFESVAEALGDQLPVLKRRLRERGAFQLGKTTVRPINIETIIIPDDPDGGVRAVKLHLEMGGKYAPVHELLLKDLGELLANTLELTDLEVASFEVSALFRGYGKHGLIYGPSDDPHLGLVFLDDYADPGIEQLDVGIALLLARHREMSHTDGGDGRHRSDSISRSAGENVPMSTDPCGPNCECDKHSPATGS